jgi:hypothetical protein
MDQWSITKAFPFQCGLLFHCSIIKSNGLNNFFYEGIILFKTSDDCNDSFQAP